MDKNKNVNIIFFDGVCVLCSGFADFILKYDQKKKRVLGRTSRSEGEGTIERK